MQGDKTQRFHVQVPNDVVYSMESTISDLELSLSRISIKNKQLQEQVNKARIKTCPNGHPLRYMYIKTTSSASHHICDVCQKNVSLKTNIFWNCTVCDFDICRNCGGYKRTVCVFNHPLEYKQKYYSSSVRCDICHTNGIKSGWHCDCDFDICEACYNI